MAEAAGAKALAASGLEPSDIDLVIVATCSPESLMPTGSATVAYRLGIVAPGAYDLNAACAGFCYAVGAAADSVRASLPNKYCDPKIAAQLFEECLDEHLLCDELGINIVSIEHHSGINSLYGASPMILGIAARQTKNVRILSLGTLISVRTDPVRIAEEYATADVISRGRLANSNNASISRNSAISFRIVRVGNISSNRPLACSVSASAAVRHTSSDISFPARIACCFGGARERKKRVSKRSLPGGVIQ